MRADQEIGDKAAAGRGRRLSALAPHLACQRRCFGCHGLEADAEFPCASAPPSFGQLELHGGAGASPSVSLTAAGTVICPSDGIVFFMGKG